VLIFYVRDEMVIALAALGWVALYIEDWIMNDDYLAYRVFYLI